MFIYAFVPQRKLREHNLGENADDLGGFQMSEREYADFSDLLLKPHLERPVPMATFILTSDEQSRIRRFLRNNSNLKYSRIEDGQEMKVTDFWYRRLTEVFGASESVWISKKEIRNDSPAI